MYSICLCNTNLHRDTRHSTATWLFHSHLCLGTLSLTHTHACCRLCIERKHFLATQGIGLEELVVQMFSGLSANMRSELWERGRGDRGSLHHEQANIISCMIALRGLGSSHRSSPCPVWSALCFSSELAQWLALCTNPLTLPPLRYRSVVSFGRFLFLVVVDVGHRCHDHHDGLLYSSCCKRHLFAPLALSNAILLSAIFLSRVPPRALVDVSTPLFTPQALAFHFLGTICSWLQGPLKSFTSHQDTEVVRYQGRQTSSQWRYPDWISFSPTVGCYQRQLCFSYPYSFYHHQFTRHQPAHGHV